MGRNYAGCDYRYMHNHDFSSNSMHIRAEVFCLMQAGGFPYMVIDAVYCKNRTHNPFFISASLRARSRQCWGRWTFPPISGHNYIIFF